MLFGRRNGLYYITNVGRGASKSRDAKAQMLNLIQKHFAPKIFCEWFDPLEGYEGDLCPEKMRLVVWDDDMAAYDVEWAQKVKTCTIPSVMLQCQSTIGVMRMLNLLSVAQAWRAGVHVLLI